MDVFSFARFAHYYPRCCMMFPTKFPQSSLLTGKWFLTMIQSNDPKIEGADACKSAFSATVQLHFYGKPVLRPGGMDVVANNGQQFR